MQAATFPSLRCLAAIAAGPVVLASCAAATPASLALVEPRAQAQDMVDQVERYVIDERELRRYYEHDATPTRAARLAQRAEAELAALKAIDFDALSLDGKVDHVLLRVEIEHQLARHADDRARLSRLSAFLPFAEPVAGLEQSRWRVDPLDASAAAAELARLAEELGELADRVVSADAEQDDAEAEDAPAPLSLSAVDALWVAGRTRGIRRALVEWYRHYETFLPEFTWWCEVPYGALLEEIDAYSKHLREEVAGQKGEDDDPMVGDPIGRDALVRDLAHEVVAYTPEELLAIGERELAWCEAELRRAAAEMGLGDDWRTALEHVKTLHVPPGEQDALVASLAREAVEWLDERDLVTIPPLCRETWRVRMILSDAQRTFPFAYYGGQHVGVAFATADMEQDAKLMAMRGNNVPFTRCVTPHELIPGHHLQGFMEERFATHRQAFATPFLGEGWALYWEMREWDLGWARTPEERVGMLFWRMHRAARIVVSLGFHLGEMSTDDMVELLVERIGHERDNALAEVRRYVGGSYGPLYQCAYMIGGLQLVALHRELVASGRMSERDFHDAILKSGPIPIEMLRMLLTADAPSKDHRAEWRFDEDRNR